MLTPYQRESRLYEQEFGHIPDDQMERIKFILGKHFENEKFNKDIEARAKKIKSIKWKSLEFVIWKRVRPSARPRFNKRGRYSRVYVPGAREAGDWFEEFAEEYKLPKIDTPCILNMKIYEKIPESFSIRKKVLAELGYLRPWKRTGDFDNYAKGIADMIQHGMLSDDCLVIDSRQQIFYSIKPHAVLEIKYMEKFPEY